MHYCAAKSGADKCTGDAAECACVTAAGTAADPNFWCAASGSCVADTDACACVGGGGAWCPANVAQQCVGSANECACVTAATAVKTWCFENETCVASMDECGCALGGLYWCPAYTDEPCLDSQAMCDCYTDATSGAPQAWCWETESCASEEQCVCEGWE